MVNFLKEVFVVFQLKLNSGKKRVVGRLDWIYRLKLALVLKNRINRNKEISIFWSKDLDKDPVHKISQNVPFRREFDENQDAIYRANVINCFGTFVFYYINILITQLFGKFMSRSKKRTCVCTFKQLIDLLDDFSTNYRGVVQLNRMIIEWCEICRKVFFMYEYIL